MPLPGLVVARNIGMNARFLDVPQRAREVPIMSLHGGKKIPLHTKKSVPCADIPWKQRHITIPQRPLQQSQPPVTSTVKTVINAKIAVMRMLDPSHLPTTINRPADGVMIPPITGIPAQPQVARTRQVMRPTFSLLTHIHPAPHSTGRSALLAAVPL